MSQMSGAITSMGVDHGNDEHAGVIAALRATMSGGSGSASPRGSSSPRGSASPRGSGARVGKGRGLVEELVIEEEGEVSPRFNFEEDGRSISAIGSLKDAVSR